MRVNLLIVALLAAVALSGCAGKQGTQEDISGPGAVDVTETTGGIRGLVVDASLRPIVGADIEVLGVGESAVSNEKGEFVVDGLDAGSYQVLSTHVFFRDTLTEAIVEANVPLPEITRITMVAKTSDRPYMTSEVQHGYISCSANLLVPGIGGFLSEECGEGTGVPEEVPVLGGQRVGKQDNNRAQIDFYLAGPHAKTLIVEQSWVPTQTITPSGGGFHTIIGTGFICDPICGTDVELFRGDGHSPHVMRVDAPALEALNITEDLRFSSFTWASSEDTGVLLEQEFTEIISVFYNLEAPANWSFLNGDEDPYQS